MRLFARKKIARIYFQDDLTESGVLCKYHPVIWETDLDYEDIYNHMPTIGQDFGDGRVVIGWDIK